MSGNLENIDLDEIPNPEPVKKIRKKKVLELENVSGEDLVLKKKKAPKEKEPKDLRSVFNKHIQNFDIESVKLPWMKTKSFRLISDPVEFEAWVDGVIADKSRYRLIAKTGELAPVIALDTETTSLDNRVIQTKSGHYIFKNEIAGICLSADGIEGLYIPITHENSDNMNRAECSRILQKLLDVSLVVFFNAKFDREILRLAMGIKLRPYPYYEDVQIFKYVIDPKADLGDKKKRGDSSGLKSISEKELSIKQIDLEQLTQVRAEAYDPVADKTTMKLQFAPFNWVPAWIALWYAAGDAITTFLLWEMFYEIARKFPVPNKIDHELVETIAWIERQRFHINSNRLKELKKFHATKLGVLRGELHKLSGIPEDEEFNPSSNPQLAKVLFEIKKFSPYKVSEKTHAPSTDGESLEELIKQHPDDEFLNKLIEYREYVALHPENLRYDPDDISARIQLRQCVVAGGRLSATGGDFYVDGGMGLNIQAIKRIEGNWWVKGRKIKLEAQTTTYSSHTSLDPSCYKMVDGKLKIAPGIKHNHIGCYFDEYYCLVPECTSCEFIDGTTIKVDAEEILNLRCLFQAILGWTFFVTDYSNIEMRVAANISKEPAFIDEFLNGEGDFHALTARAVFPEYSDPETPKARKKELRDLAKILNFSLLYGGSAYTIYESMKKVNKLISFDACKQMVDRYWEGVPRFAAWVSHQQAIARDKMICMTPMGRVVGFKSLMDSYKITVPNEEDKQNYRRYWDIKNKADEFEADGDTRQAEKYNKMCNAMYRDESSGIRNMKEYKKFLGKIQRVAINIPLQGLAGDFMRVSLNRIREFVQKDIQIERIFQLHASVHDEIDYSVKNEYVPFIIPRLTRIMKLRDIHAKQNWQVPIECDTEYGSSWDVTEHLTGDKDHEPAGWTNISGLEEYIPGGVSEEIIEKLMTILSSSDPAKAINYLNKNLHSKCITAIDSLIKCDKTDLVMLKRKLIICFQLDEYWTIDGIPFDEDDKLERLEDYEKRLGLNPDSKPPISPCGYLGELQVRERPQETEQPHKVDSIPEPEVDEDPFAPQIVLPSKSQTISTGFLVADKNPAIVINPSPAENTTLVVTHSKYETLRPDMDKEDWKELMSILGIGNNTARAVYNGQLVILSKVFKTEIPEKFLYRSTNGV